MNNNNRTLIQTPRFSEAIEDSSIFGVVTVVSETEAFQLGAFEEDALSVDDAWDSQADFEAEDVAVAAVLTREGEAHEQ